MGYEKDAPPDSGRAGREGRRRTCHTAEETSEVMRQISDPNDRIRRALPKPLGHWVG